MPPMCGQQQGYQEPRTHILDWQQRMDRWHYEDSYQKPKRGRARSRASAKGISTADFRSVYPWPHVPEATCINTQPKRTPMQSQIAVQSIAQLFGGGGGC